MVVNVLTSMLQQGAEYLERLWPQFQLRAIACQLIDCHVKAKWPERDLFHETPRLRQREILTLF